ncbi:hypothetical protein TVAG_063220 [Trichomonas vaginalis G3]|uniref:GDA1/CD39 family protein n=1 Tax=Trichomonas vaginalis (strain ATCC PRA-98 / G3) TaxID=412133 RepID=A2DLT4_TRIV3|nr:8-oxo-dGTP phosphohydrolase protein [Trichomonas vaginalis G3]EAY18717.1 hypothetical protein TVAG_063220 [Trichomonas vaginalis G3]KAI5522621.1 8-oxo-dGTP phosphohydrolase protein [Trichomonas vaginalis G3]|eukprot:XP_001579703.1 hypothetical protein [Trichomonas vaginalis G3]
MLSLLFATSLSKAKYGIMVDAGSSGTRAFVYTWDSSSEIPDLKPVYENGKPLKKKIKIRLADSAKKPELVEEIFKPICEFAEKYVPAKLYSSTPMYVFATAGMRLLGNNQQNQVCDQVYGFISKNYKFKISRQNIRVINGVEEGVYGWLSVNLLLGNFKENKPYYGAMDLGGASFQIAVEVNENDKYEESLLVTVGTKRIRVFSHSYLGYGVDVSSRSITKAISAVTDSDNISNPCFPKGYTDTIVGKDTITVHGTGDFEKCSKIAKKILIDGPHFETVNIPGISNINKLVGMANLYFANAFFGLPTTSSLADLKTKGTEYCARDWKDISKELQGKESLEYAHTYCYCAAYQYVLLTKGFNFNDQNAEIQKLDDINGIDLSWAIGAMLAHISDVEIVKEENIPFTALIFANIVAFSVLLPLYLVIKRKFSAQRYIRESHPL